MNSSIAGMVVDQWNQTQQEIMDEGAVFVPPQWMIDFVDFRERLFLQTVEPIIELLLGPLEEENEHVLGATVSVRGGELYPPIHSHSHSQNHLDADHRRLTYDFMPDYSEDPYAYRNTSMSFATLMMLFVLMSCVLVIFLSCFYHNQKTSPLFISPRRHRLPKLVPPPLPVEGYFDWVSSRLPTRLVGPSTTHSHLLSLPNDRSKCVFSFQTKRSFNELDSMP